MTNRLSLAAGAALLALAGSAAAQVTFYEHPDFRGRAYTISGDTADMGRIGFGNRASSAIVERGRWLVCHDAGYRGDCTVLRPGQYTSLRDAGFEDSISSVRRVNNQRRAEWREYDAPPAAQPAYEWRQRPNERTFEAPVRSAVAVRGSPEQRCWTERERVSEQREMSAPGAIIGGIVGGILGHQVGKGSGNTAATIGGAVGGAALGANAGRIKDRITGRDVERCENVSSGRVEYYDVTYDFRGTTHRVQTQTDPGRTITVNQRGEPRG